MRIDAIKAGLSRSLTNLKGWRTNRKFIILESDDWGSIRMPNHTTFQKFAGLDAAIQKDPYCQNDTLAGPEDMQVLYETLSKFKTVAGKHPIITFNTVVGNPDFEFIKAHQFKDYQFEKFTDTLKRYYPKDDVFGLWKEGIRQKLIKPQYHGREHINVPLWLNELQNGNKLLLDAFNHQFCNIPGVNNLSASYNSSSIENIAFYQKSIEEGLDVFETIFGFPSKTFIANNYVLPDPLEKTLKKAKVIGIQSMKYVKRPLSGKTVLDEIYTGKRNSLGQIYTVRNCSFEPSQRKPGYDSVKNCLSQISQSFFFKKPAIISCHRLNFIGQIQPKNRTQNIKSFEELLKTILNRWPEVEFLSSDELIDIIMADSLKQSQSK